MATPAQRTPRLFFKMSRSSRRRAFSRRNRVSSSVLWAQPPLPGKAASPCVSSSWCHLYRWLRQFTRNGHRGAARRFPQPDGFQFELFGELLSLRHRTPPGDHCPLFEVSTKVGLAQNVPRELRSISLGENRNTCDGPCPMSYQFVASGHPNHRWVCLSSESLSRSLLPPP